MHWSIKKKPERCYIDHKARVRQKDFIVFWSKNCGLEDSKRCREFNQNLNLWETKQIEKTHAKENNHTHKTIFTWFGNLPTSTELQRFHYKIRRYNSTQENSQETQFPIHPNSLLPTRQENTILSSYATARLLGIFFFNSHGLPYITNLIYI